MTDRQTEILKYFLNHADRHITAHELQSIVRLSERTLRNEINTLNTLFDMPIISSVRGKGYIISSKQNIPMLHTHIQKVRMRQNNVMIDIAYTLLTAQSSMTYKVFEDTYLLTRSELKNHLSTIHSWLSKYDIKMVIKPSEGIYLDGDVKDLRRSIKSLKDLTNDSTQSPYQLLYRGFQEKHLEIIKLTLNKTLKHYQINYNDNQLTQIYIHILIITKLHSKNENDLIIHNLDAYNIAQHCLNSLSHKLPYTYSNNDVIVLSYYIDYYFFTSQSHHYQLEDYVHTLVGATSTMTGYAFTKDDTLIENIQSHLNNALNRIQNGIYVSNPLTNDIKSKYTFLFNTIYISTKELEQQFDIKLNDDEVAFLVLHFQTSLDIRLTKESKAVNVLIVCYYGTGISNLIKAKLLNAFQNINVKNIVSTSSFETENLHDIDLIITTNEITINSNIDNLEVIQISPFFSDDDKKKLRKYFELDYQSNNLMTSHNDIRDIVSVCWSYETNIYKLIKSVVSPLHEKGEVTEHFLESVLNREKFSSTYIGESIAMPHGDPNEVYHSSATLIFCPEGVNWQGRNVQLVVLLAMKHKDISFTQTIIKRIATLTSSDIEAIITEHQIHQSKYEILNKIL